MPEQDEVKIINVYGDKHARERNAVPAYQRYVHAQEVTFICQRCHQEMTEVRFPGPLKYCAECASVVKREKSRTRTQRSRQKVKAQLVPPGVKRFRAQNDGGASWRVVDTEITTKPRGEPFTVRWFPVQAGAERYAEELNQTRGHASDESKCVNCGAQPAGGEGPRCAACHSRLADMHG